MTDDAADGPMTDDEKIAILKFASREATVAASGTAKQRDRFRWLAIFRAAEDVVRFEAGLPKLRDGAGGGGE